MRHRPRDNRDFDPSDYQFKSRVNPYFNQIHQFPQHLIPFPDKPRFAELLSEKRDQIAASVTSESCLNSAENDESVLAELHVEIGCGSGRFMLESAQQHPHHLYIGFELRYKRLVKCAQKAHNQGIDNLLFVRDQGEFMNEYFSEHSLSAVYVFFPDPWAKKAQRKHRLLRHEFFDKLKGLLKPGGQFVFKTDHQEYFQSTLELLNQRPDWKIDTHTHDLHQSQHASTNILTEFEMLFLAKTKPVIGFLTASVV